jgi:hypothetical protein
MKKPSATKQKNSNQKNQQQTSSRLDEAVDKINKFYQNNEIE